jgi:hypothetical protein
MAAYIPKFFIYKFGIESISAFYLKVFNEYVEEYASSQSSWILTFLSIRNGECE